MGKASFDHRSPFPGNTRIFCHGKVVTSSAFWWLGLTLGMYAVPLGLFFWLILPSYVQVVPVWTLAVLFVLLVVSVLSLFKTATTDPGILVRGTAPQTLLLSAALPNNVKLVMHPNNPDVVIGKDVEENGRIVHYKYCSTCEIFRPPRASHCSLCDNCVDEFDHHCPWVSNCIGIRNLRFFMYYIASTAFLCIFFFCSLVSLLVRSYRQEPVIEYLIVRAFGVVFLAMYCFSIGLALAGFLIYYLILIGDGLTSNERIKRRRGVIVQPPAEDGGTSENFKRVFCLPRPPKSVQWKNYRS